MLILGITLGFILTLVTALALISLYQDKQRYRMLLESELAQKELQQRFLVAFKASPVACSIASLELGRYVDINAAYTRTFGWTAEEVIGRTSLEIGLWPNEASRAEWIAMLREKGQIIDHEAIWHDKQGRPRAVSTSCGLVDLHGEPHVLAFCMDITERRKNESELNRYRQELEQMVEQRTEALATALDKAESANQAKSTFLTNISHELRTPINAIQGFIHLAHTGAVEREQRERLDRAANAADDLAAMIGSLIDLARIEANTMVLEPADFATQPLVERIMQLVKPAAQAKGLLLSCEITPGFPSALHGDARRLAQILSSFLSNAVKFTERGSVTLTLSHRAASNGQAEIRCQVRDTGIGIAPAVQDRLFEPFAQLDPSITRRHGGIGVDLSICRAFARLMGGQIGVESQPGTGSSFWLHVTLPLARLETVPSDSDQLLPSASATTDNDTLPVGLDNIVGLDVQFGLTALRGKLPSYLRLLRQFADHHAGDPSLIRQSLTAGDLDTARRQAHSLKGASGTLGIVAVQQLAAKLEAAIRDQEDNGSMEKWLSEVKDTLHRIISQIQNCLPADLNATPLTIDPETVAPLLAQLEALLADDNVSCTALARQHEVMLLAVLGAEYAVFSQYLDNFDFEPALSLLRKARQRHPSLNAS